VNDTERSRQVDELFRGLDCPHTPGAIVAVARGDEVVHLRGYGRASVEFDSPWTADTRYRIASITKQFTATAILLLEEQGRLALDDDMRTYLPELPVFAPPITIRHLLQMTSGLKLDELLASVFTANAGPHSLDYLYRMFRQRPLTDFTPGQYALYCDTNYRFAARIIERVTNADFGGALAELIFRPLGMNDSSAPPDYAVVQPRLAYLYEVLDDGTYRRIEEGMAMSGDGAIISTVADLLRWNEHLRQGLLGSPGLRERWTTVATLNDGRQTNYGLGVTVGHHRDRLIWEHGGLFGSHLLRFPREDVTIIVLRNRTDLSAWTLAHRVADLFLLDTPPSDDGHQWRAWFGADLAMAQFPLNPDVVGRYVHAESGYFLDLQIVNGMLLANLIDGGAVMTPSGPDTFVATGHEAFGPPLTIVRLPEQPPQIDVDIGAGSAWRFVRWDAAPDACPPDGLTPFVGTYANRDFDMYQRVLLQDGRLLLQFDRGQTRDHLRPLTWLGGDNFVCEPGTSWRHAQPIAVRFERDAPLGRGGPGGEQSGEIVRMIESVDSVRNICFERTSRGETLADD
jgi:CubicO group peptidase (beta-lactamase class C family)